MVARPVGRAGAVRPVGCIHLTSWVGRIRWLQYAIEVDDGGGRALGGTPRSTPNGHAERDQPDDRGKYDD